MKKAILLFLYLLSFNLQAQSTAETDTLSLLFMGDVMGHQPQIAAAYNPDLALYEYDDVFAPVAPLLQKADFAIANLEVTLAGPPYTGYPQFSSPDALAVACRNSGIDVLVTANNHSCDKGRRGIMRTLQVLDSLNIKHTGTFRDATERERNNLLLLEKNHIRIGLLNYTYGTNGLPVPPPAIVNLIDTVAMAADIKKSRLQPLDKLIVMLHWGTEYESLPSPEQETIARFLFKKGVDIIIGSHPHVLQPMEYFPNIPYQQEQFIAYSLGNFVSNQRTRKRDGGVILSLNITKTPTQTTISQSGYYLTWVHKPLTPRGESFEILPCSVYEENGFGQMNEASVEQMKLFIEDTRALFKKYNKGVNELRYEP